MALKKKLPRWLKWTGILVTIIAIGLLTAYLSFNEKKPKGKSGPEAEALAEKMLLAIDKTGWDTTAVVQWTFKGFHSYLWDKQRHLTKVSWDDYEVLLDINKIEGRVWKDGEEITGTEGAEIVKKAWEFWCNDSFWLNAPAKCMDPGTSRSLVKMDDGTDALMVSYSSGGVTPGDSYLWILDKNGLPLSYKMWVKIIPVGGMEFTWEDWATLPTGARIAQMHNGPKVQLDIGDLKGAASLEDFGLTTDPFLPILR